MYTPVMEISHIGKGATSTSRKANLLVVMCILAALSWSVLRPWLGGWGGCLAQTWFGSSCPLCGLTRAFGALIGGDVSAASALHPLALPLAVLVAVELLVRCVALCIPTRLRIPARIDMFLHLAFAGLYVLFCLWHWTFRIGAVI